MPLKLVQGSFFVPPSSLSMKGATNTVWCVLNSRVVKCEYFSHTPCVKLYSTESVGGGGGEKTRGRITISVHTHTYIRSCVCVKNNFPFHINHPGCRSRKVREACLRCLLSSCNFLISINIHALEVRLEVAGAWTLNVGLLVISSPKTCWLIKSHFMAFYIISHRIKLSQWALWSFWTQIHANIYVKWGKLRQIHKHTIDV